MALRRDGEGGDEMRHPKNCNGCKALYQSQYSFTCELGYDLDVKVVKSINGADIKYVSPKFVACPKPKTNDELVKSIMKGYSNDRR